MREAFLREQKIKDQQSKEQQIKDQAARKLRQPRRPIWLCPVGRGTPSACGAKTKVMTQHLKSHFTRGSKEVGG